MNFDMDKSREPQNIDDQFFSIKTSIVHVAEIEKEFVRSKERTVASEEDRS